MVGWGAVGVGGGLLALATRGRELGRVSLALACGRRRAGLRDVHGRLPVDAVRPAGPRGLSRDLRQLRCRTTWPTRFGNVVFCLLIGPVFIRALRRYRRRFEVRWERPAGPLGARTAVAAWWRSRWRRGCTWPRVSPADGGGPVGPARPPPRPARRRWPTCAARRTATAASAAPRGASSSQLFTGWSALGLAAAGRQPARRGAPRRPVADRLPAPGRARSATPASWSARSSCSRRRGSRGAASAGATSWPSCCAASAPTARGGATWRTRPSA